MFDLISWIIRGFFFGSIYRFNFVKKRLQIFTKEKNDKLIRLFANYYLGMDGVFILRLLEYNTSATLTYDLLSKMWHQFKTSLKAN